MTYLIRSTGARAVLWLAALAAPTAFGQATVQPAQPAQPHPADASAPVPPTRYVQMPMPVPVPMSNARLAAPASPAANWKALNQAVAAYDAMSLSMETGETAAPMAPTMAHPPVQLPAPDAHSHHMHKELK